MRLLGVVCAAALLPACTMINTEPMVLKTAAPTQGAGYVAGIFKRDTIGGFGFGLVELNTQREFVISVEKDDVGMIEVPPGEYQVAYWVTYGRLIHDGTKREIPPEDGLATPFTVYPGAVVLLGRWNADISYGSVTALWILKPDPIGTNAAIDLFKKAYPGFARAAVQCIACEY